MTRSHRDDPTARGGHRAQALRRRCAHLAAEGCTAAEIAGVEGVEERHVEDLLGDEAFGRLVRGYEVFGSRPDAERRAKLVRLAQNLIDEAIGLGHVRVAFFVVREELNGRDAAETVADKLIRQRAKAAEPLPPAPESVAQQPARRPHLPAHPADRMAQRGCRDLMRALLAEVRARGAAMFRTLKCEPVATVRPDPIHRCLVAKLLTGVAAVAPYDGFLPKFAQAP